MKRIDFKAVTYLICTYIACFGMIYLMWIGASYMFIDKALTKANYLRHCDDRSCRLACDKRRVLHLLQTEEEQAWRE